MSTRFNSNVFAIFCTNFAQLEGRSHFTVEFILLLSHFDVVFGGGLHGPAQIGIDIPTIREQITANKVGNVNLKLI